jgi:hypothetical protein
MRRDGGALRLYGGAHHFRRRIMTCFASSKSMRMRGTIF